MDFSFEALHDMALHHPDQCLAKIDRLVDYLFCEPLTVGKLFGSVALDDFCQRVGQRHLTAQGLTDPPSVVSEAVVYIASRLQSSGGHTSVLAETIQYTQAQRTIIIITQLCGKSDSAAIEKYFAAFPAVWVWYVPPGSHLEKLGWVQQWLQRIAPRRVWLFNHHQDSVAVAAVQPNRGYQLNFYHHGDDRLCLGTTLAYAHHYDLAPFQFSHCRHHLGITNNRYLPLTCCDQGVIGSDTLRESRWVTCTAAGHNKLEAGYLFEYVKVIPRVLKETQGKHIHIGRLSPLALFRLRCALKRLGLPLNSFVYIPYVPSVWTALKAHQVDLYIASFPHGGGKTMVEVMGAGVPIAIHQHVANRLIGGFDLVYDGAFSWREPKTLYRFIRSIDRPFLVAQGRMARSWYETYHAEATVSRICREEDFRVDVPSLKPGYCADAWLSGVLLAHEVSVHHLLKRHAYYLFRRFRARLGRMIAMPMPSLSDGNKKTAE